MEVYRPNNRNFLVKAFENWLFDGKPPRTPHATIYRPRSTDPSNRHSKWGPGVDRHVARSLDQHRPRFHTEMGLQQAQLHSIEVSKVTGETIAFYDLKYRGHDGWMRSTRYLYGIRHGIISQLRAYETRFYR